MRGPVHVLKNLRLPARYEKLEELIAGDVAKILIAPDVSLAALERLALASTQTGEGLLAPCWGPTGAGKTTLIENLHYFLPHHYTATLSYQGLISFDALAEAVQRHVQRQPPSNGQIVPINIDHREGSPPSEEELASLKRFARTSRRPCLIAWLETDRARAEGIAERYTQITGNPAVPLPLNIEGPARETWHDIVLNTLQLCNGLSDAAISDLGVDPGAYDLRSIASVGEYLRRVSTDFTALVASHEASTRRPVTLVLNYVSEALDRGCLPSFTSSGSEAGLLDARALINCTPDSMIGRKWAEKRGMLTQTILRLDARAFWLPPAAAAAMLRRSGPPEVQGLLSRRSLPSPADIETYLGRTDLGRYLAEVRGAAYEARGRPAEDAAEALRTVARDYGYSAGHDKLLNRAILEWVRAYMGSVGLNVADATAETALSFCPSIIPDQNYDLGDRVICLEYVWRSGNSLDSSRRSEAAQYALEKLHNYAVNFGWIAP